MPFTSTGFFLLFLPILLILYYLPICKARTCRNIILITAGIIFYALGDPAHMPLIFISALLNFAFVRLSRRGAGFAFLRYAAVAADVSILVFYKYINCITCFEHGPFPFPLGLSFFTFMAVSYCIDSRTLKTHSFTDAMLYMTFFPAITSGPITQFENICGQIRGRKESMQRIIEGSYRFACGFIKKVLFADILGFLVADCFDAGPAGSVFAAWLGAFAYTLQLYLDFSGYSDMAIGTGKMFGIDLCENFNYPYDASSITEFWKRWHISLTAWFKKYVYIPMGGNRVSLPRHLFNLFAVWLLTGMWHGTGFTFVVWGMMHLAVLLLEKFTKLKYVPRIFGRMYTVFTIFITWTVFRSSSLTHAADYIGSMFGIGVPCFCDDRALAAAAGFAFPLILGALICLPVGPALAKLKIRGNLSAEAIVAIPVFIAFIISVLMCMGANFSAPLYAGF